HCGSSSVQCPIIRTIPAATPGGPGEDSAAFSEASELRGTGPAASRQLFLIHAAHDATPDVGGRGRRGGVAAGGSQHWARFFERLVFLTAVGAVLQVLAHGARLSRAEITAGEERELPSQIVTRHALSSRVRTEDEGQPGRGNGPQG